MYQPAPSTAFVPGKKTRILPENVGDVTPGQTVSIHVPSYVEFVDPRGTELVFTAEMVGGRGMFVPDPDAAGHAFFRTLTVRSGDGSCQLEFLDDYNCSMAALRFYSRGGAEARRQMFEGEQPSTSRANGSLYYGKDTANYSSATASASAVPVTSSTRSPKIAIRLGSGLLSGKQIIPVGLMNGLKADLDVEVAGRALRQLSLAGSESQVVMKPAAPIVVGTSAVAKGADFSVATSYAATTDGAKANPPVVTGDLLYIKDADGGNEEVLGVVKSIFYDTDKLTCVVSWQGASDGYAHVRAVDALIYWKPADRSRALTYNTGPATTATLPAASFKLSDISLDCLGAEPPQGYADGMAKAAQTEKGITFDLQTFTVYRQNIAAIQGTAHCLIPAMETRARTVIVQPLDVATTRDMSAASFRGILDDIQGYQFIFGTKQSPSAEVDLTRLSMSPAKSSPIHLTENEKALVSIGQPVTSFCQSQQQLLISRAFAKYGNVSDLTTEALSLRARYGSAASKAKIFNCMVWHLRAVNISRSGVSAMI